MEQILNLLLLGVVVFAAGLALRKGPSSLLFLYVALVPWFGLQTNIGLTLTSDRIVAFLLLGAVAMRRGTHGFRGFGVFFLFLILNTVAQSVSLPITADDYSAFQGRWRWLFQVLMWSLFVGAGAALAANGKRNALLAYRYLCYSAGILAALGIVQFALFYITGIDIFPLGLFGDAGEYRSGAFGSDSFMGGYVFRASSLGGEPKHLSYSMVVGLTILACDQVLDGHLGISPRRRLTLAGVMLLALVLSFSTQGFVLLSASFVALVLYAGVVRGVTKAQRNLLAAILAVAAAVLAVPELAEVLVARSFGRVVELQGLEDWNVAVLDWLSETPAALPLGVGLGNVHLYAAPWVPQESLYYMRGSIFVAKSGGLRLLSEAGLVGLALFLAAAVVPVRRLLVSARDPKSPAGAHAAMAGLIVFDYLLSGDGPMFAFIAIGVAWAVAFGGVSSVRTTSVMESGDGPGDLAQGVR